MKKNDDGDDRYVAGPNAGEMDGDIAELGQLLRKLSNYGLIEIGKMACVVAIKQAGENGLTESDMETIARGVATELSNVTPLAMAFENVIDFAVVDGKFGYRRNANTLVAMAELKTELKYLNRRISELN